MIRKVTRVCSTSLTFPFWKITGQLRHAGYSSQLDEMLLQDREHVSPETEVFSPYTEWQYLAHAQPDYPYSYGIGIIH